MSVIIGSARIDENGHAYNGVAGDQKQTSTPDTRGEVSMQSFYVHSKGWYIFRAKKDKHAEKLAKCMKRACNNANIGYDQWQRDNIVRDHTDSAVKTECDCSSLVRECIIEATGIDPGNIRTISMPEMLPRTGLFKPTLSYKEGMPLYTGDILCTKTSGHTVIVVSGESRGKKNKDTDNTRVARPTLRKGDKSIEVRCLQKNLNALGITDERRVPLVVDGEFGDHTVAALKKFQKAYKIEVDEIYGPESAETMETALKGVADGK